MQDLKREGFEEGGIVDVDDGEKRWWAKQQTHFQVVEVR